MQSFNDFIAAASSYAASLFALIGWIIIDHSATWVSLAGFVLLCARLVVEVPKAFRVLKAWGKSDG